VLVNCAESAERVDWCQRTLRRRGQRSIFHFLDPHWLERGWRRISFYNTTTTTTIIIIRAVFVAFLLEGIGISASFARQEFFSINKCVNARISASSNVQQDSRVPLKISKAANTSCFLTLFTALYAVFYHLFYLHINE